MTLRPIDLQVMLPRVSEISRTQQIQNQHDQNQAGQFASELNKQTKQAEHQVQNTNETEGRTINREKEKGSPDQEKQKKKGAQPEEQESESSLPADPNRGTRLDIKV
ncbi:MAG TPA: hypothetical protein VHS59_14650 [Bacillota bacterium]|nr:hypothetical protein [Bacillota bacterium]